MRNIKASTILCLFLCLPVIGFSEVRKTYYESGKLNFEVNYKNGKEEGLYKEYYESGELKRELNYKNGKQEGLGKLYYKSGKLKVKTNHKNDKREGLAKTYYESGQLEAEGNFKNDKQEGSHKEYYESGKLKLKTNYKNDQQEGLAKTYYESGKLKQEVNFKNGKPEGPFNPLAEERVLSRNETLQLCEAQELLTDLGYSVGPIDGKAGYSTQQATIAFLNDSGVQIPDLSDQVILKHLRLHHEIEHKTNTKKIPNRTNRPINGQVFHPYGKEEVAPLEIITPSKGYDFYVKLSDVNDVKTSKTFYVRGGSRVETKVPLGSFNIKYATGKEWKSENCLFGINTLYNKAEKVFEFKKVGNQLSGYSVELILQIEGNLSTSKISPDEW